MDECKKVRSGTHTSTKLYFVAEILVTVIQVKARAVRMAIGMGMAVSMLGRNQTLHLPNTSNKLVRVEAKSYM